MSATNPTTVQIPTHAAPAEAPAFTLFAVFRVSSSHPEVFDGRDVSVIVREFEDVVSVIGDEGVVLRGCYDVSGLRSDADLMLWLHGNAAEDLQWALRLLRRTQLMRPLVRVWGATGVDREAEVSRQEAPAFVRGEAPREWLAVSTFSRPAAWYLLEPAERDRLLAEQSEVTAGFSGTASNTVAAFALGEAEWLRATEADDVTELVDLARAQRGIDARSFVLAETTSFTGRRIEIVEAVEVLQ